MATVLESIIDGVRRDMRVRQAEVSLHQLRDRAEKQLPALDALAALRGKSPGSFGIISEVKRSSPSRGMLADIADPAELAASYEAGGAAAVSVLTEQRRFGGSLDDLAAVRQRVTVPVLRKDFIVDEYQIWEARAWGADLVLLIVAALDDESLRSFLDLTHCLGMNALVEVHTPDEVVRAEKAGAKIVGVNVRNLKTLEVNRSHYARLASYLPQDTVLVAESGVESADDVAAYASHGAQAVLVGEALVKSGDPSRAVADFRRAGMRARERYLGSQGRKR